MRYPKIPAFMVTPTPAQDESDFANSKYKLMTQGIKPMTGEEDTCQM